MLMVLALVSLGMGYGLWSKTLTIDGTVNTGEVNAELSIQEVDEGDFEMFNQNDISEDMEVEGKDIAECDVALNSSGVSPDLINPGAQYMSITITDAYPSFHCWVEFDVHNNGTIPIKLHAPVITNPNPATVLTVDTLWCYHWPFVPPPPPPVIDPHAQLEPSETVFCVLHVHVEQDAEQDADYTFGATVFAHQWNEEP